MISIDELADATEKLIQRYEDVQNGRIGNVRTIPGLSEETKKTAIAMLVKYIMHKKDKIPSEKIIKKLNRKYLGSKHIISLVAHNFNSLYDVLEIILPGIYHPFDMNPVPEHLWASKENRVAAIKYYVKEERHLTPKEACQDITAEELRDRFPGLMNRYGRSVYNALREAYCNRISVNDMKNKPNKILKKNREIKTKRMEESATKRKEEIKNTPFEQIDETFEPYLETLCNNYGSKTSEKEDCMQVARTALFKAYRDYNGKTYFNAIASRYVINALISEKRLCERIKRNRFIKIPKSNQEQFPGQRQPKDLIEFITQNLSELERNVITGRISGFSYKEIAKKLSIQEKSIGNAMDRARNKIKIGYLLQ